MTNQEAARQKRQQQRESAERRDSATRSGLQSTGAGGWSSNGPMPSKRPAKPNAADYAGEGGLGAGFTVPEGAKDTGDGVVWEIGPDMIPRRKK